MSHTKEPWVAVPHKRDTNAIAIFTRPTDDLPAIATVWSLGAKSMQRDNEANAARIVECVNACAGIANPAALPELVAAVESMLGAFVMRDLGHQLRCQRELANAFAKLKGGA